MERNENFNVLMSLIDIENWYLGINQNEPNALCLLCEDVDLIENLSIKEC